MSEKLEIIIAGKDQFSGVFGKLQKALPSIKTLAVGAGAAITGVGASLAAMTKSTAEAYDRVQKLSDQLGISTEFLSSLEHAADLSGIKIETMNKSVQSLQVRIGEAGRGVGQAKDAFDALGVSLQTSSGQLKTAEQIMPELADAFHNMTNATERAEAASKIFGQRGMSMIQMFKDGREGLAAMTEEAEKFGLVVSEKAGQNAAEFNDSLTRLTGAFTGVKNAIAEQSMEIFAGIANSLADFIANNRGKIAEFVNDIVKSGVTIYIGFKEVIEKVTRIFSMLTNKEGFEILVSNAKTALQAIGQLYLLAAPAYAETLLTVMKAAFEALVEIGRWAWENIKAAFTGADGPSLGDLVFDSLSRVVTERRGEIEAIWQGVAESAKPHFETLKTSIVNVLGDDVIETIRQKSAALSEAFSLGGTGEDGEPRGMPGLTDGDVEKSMENGQLFLEWYYEMLEEQRAAKQAFADFEEELEKKRLKDKLKREKEELKGRAKTLDAISGLQRTFHLEGFNLTKAAAIPETIMATHEGAIQAYKAMAGIPVIGPALGAAAAAAVIAYGAVQLASIKGQNFAAAHGGLDYVPKEQTYLLDRGERVLSPSQNRDLTEFLRGGAPIGVENLSIEVHAFENVTNARALHDMSAEDWEEITRDNIIPALSALARMGITVRP